MRKLATAILGALVLSGLVLGGAAAQDKKGAPAPAQKKAAAPKEVSIRVIAENAKVRVTEVTYAPGAENKSTSRATMRIVRALKGGTLERTYADGRKENVTYKNNEVHINEPGPQYDTRNVSTGAVVLYVVTIK